MNIHCISGIGLDSNVYIIEAERSYIIDTGTGLYNQSIIGKLDKLGILKKIKGIVLTHRHVDHTGGANSLANKLGSKLYSSEIEATVLRQPNEATTCAFMVGIDMPALPVKDIGNEIDCGDAKYKVIIAPGHTDGHIVLYDKENLNLFCGDVIFGYGGVGRWDLPSGSYNALLKSVESLSKLNIKNLYPGHGPYIEDDAQAHVKMAFDNLRVLQ